MAGLECLGATYVEVGEFFVRKDGVEWATEILTKFSKYFELNFIDADDRTRFCPMKHQNEMNNLFLLLFSALMYYIRENPTNKIRR